MLLTERVGLFPWRRVVSDEESVPPIQGTPHQVRGKLCGETIFLLKEKRGRYASAEDDTLVIEEVPDSILYNELMIRSFSQTRKRPAVGMSLSGHSLCSWMIQENQPG